MKHLMCAAAALLIGGSVMTVSAPAAMAQAGGSTMETGSNATDMRSGGMNAKKSGGTMKNKKMKMKKKTM